VDRDRPDRDPRLSGQQLPDAIGRIAANRDQPGSGRADDGRLLILVGVVGCERAGGALGAIRRIWIGPTAIGLSVADSDGINSEQVSSVRARAGELQSGAIRSGAVDCHAVRHRSTVVSRVAGGWTVVACCWRDISRSSSARGLPGAIRLVVVAARPADCWLE